ncbi:MAG TPA: PspC domain-containing protein [Chitinivibrionales bacterium]|nr:PspC domain-containing protein [Chitinivibrionales bacterium]
MKRIYRDTDNKMVAGICAGIGEMINVDPTIVRLAFVFVTLVTVFFPCIIAYLVGWVIIPEKKDLKVDPDKKQAP